MATSRVPQAHTDRSLGTQLPGKACRKRDRPVGHGMIGRTWSQRYFSSKGEPCFLRNAKYSRFAFDDVRGLLPDVMGFPVFAFEISSLQPSRLSQALRAWLRSHRPSGTLRNSL